MRARIGLLLWLLGLLFPLAALGRFSGTYRTAFDALFGSEWVHIVMHMVLYAVLSILATLALKLPLGRRTIWIVLLIILGIGSLQEIIQATSQGIELLKASTLSRAVFDLGVDLVGGLAGLALLRYAQTRKQTAAAHDPNIPGVD